MFPRPTVAALNHLLTQNSWALQRLAPFAGKTARFDIAPFSLAFTILNDGSLRGADENIKADAVCNIAPSLLPRLALHDENAYAEIISDGDSGLLAAIFFLSRNLRWDAADDLSHLTGDIAAERIVQAVNTTHQQLHGSVENFSQAIAEYFTEERPLLVNPQLISAFVQQVDTLRDDTARLEQRIKALYSSHPEALLSNSKGKHR